MPTKAHAELGASSSKRWIECPGSIALSRGIATPPTTAYAIEGTAAHAVAEMCLRDDRDPSAYIGLEVEGVEVTESMAEHVAVYVNRCRAEMMLADRYWIERQFTLIELDPPAPMFGTADFVSIFRDQLTVIDLKYGAGVDVPAVGNPQLRYYALGALRSLAPAERARITRVRMEIIQPRTAGPAAKVDECSVVELHTFADALMAAARRTQEPNAPLHAGTHCKFCPASGACPEQMQVAQALAQVEFSALPADVPPPPELLPNELLGDFLAKVHILEDWASALRAQAEARLARGEDVPGFKLVARRARRAWTDDDVAASTLATRFHLHDDELYTRKLKSPAQLEKVVGKRHLPTDLWTAVSSGATLAPATDPRPAVALSRGDEFPLLPSADND